MESKLYNYAKCSIPVLNNTSPNNYAIMSALLSHIDSPLVSSSSLLTSSINSYPNIISSPSLTNQTIQSTYLKSNRQKSQKQTKSNNFSSSKEIIYTTKRLRLQSIDNTETSPNIVMLNSEFSLNEPSESNSVDGTTFETNQLNDLIVIETRKDSEANNFTTETNFNSYESNVFSETTGLIEENTQEVLTNETFSIQEQPLVTYTISCPSDWQYNLNQMLNCFICLDKNQTCRSVKLKCSVCLRKFSNLNDLSEHKDQNDKCKNEINILSTCEDVPNDCHDKIELEDDEDEFFDEDEDFEKLDDDEELNNFYLYDCDDEILDEYESSLNDDSNDEPQFNDKNNYFYYNNKLVAKVKLKNNVKIRHKDSESDIDKEDIQADKINNLSTSDPKPVKTRRKYTKSKANMATNLNCEKCNKTCRTKAELLVHLHKHAGNGPECWECGKKCASFSNLVSHVQLHTGEKPYTCQFCGKQFTQDAHLTRHIRLHTGERPFVCNICGKNYKDYSYYKTHLRIHRGERLYKCNYCGKEYYDASYYKKHTRLHTGEKPYMCTVCGRQFHRSDYLKLHSYSHTDERPFNCHICGKGFKMNYNLKVHLKNHENQDLLNQSSVISSSNDETSSFNENEQYTNPDQYCSNTINLSLSNSTNEIVSLFASNHIGLDANTIQIINNSANQSVSSALNEIDVTILDDHQIRIVN